MGSVASSTAPSALQSPTGGSDGGGSGDGNTPTGQVAAEKQISTNLSSRALSMYEVGEVLTRRLIVLMQQQEQQQDSMDQLLTVDFALTDKEQQLREQLQHALQVYTESQCKDDLLVHIQLDLILTASTLALQTHMAARAQSVAAQLLEHFLRHYIFNAAAEKDGERVSIRAIVTWVRMERAWRVIRRRSSSFNDSKRRSLTSSASPAPPSSSSFFATATSIIPMEASETSARLVGTAGGGDVNAMVTFDEMYNSGGFCDWSASTILRLSTDEAFIAKLHEYFHATGNHLAYDRCINCPRPGVNQWRRVSSVKDNTTGNGAEDEEAAEEGVADNNVEGGGVGGGRRSGSQLKSSLSERALMLRNSERHRSFRTSTLTSRGLRTARRS